MATRKSPPVNTAPKLVWQDPPEGPMRIGRHDRVYEPILEKVRAQPGRWARIRVMSEQAAASLRKRLHQTHHSQDPAWEFRVAKFDKNGTAGVYVRYRTAAQIRKARKAEEV